MLPDNPYPTDEQVVVKIGKMPYARFDLNDYPVPHDSVQRTLTVLADLKQVRLLNGQEVIATHSQSFDLGAQIENPDHVLRPTVFKAIHPFLFEVRQCRLTRTIIGRMHTEDSARQNTGF